MLRYIGGVLVALVVLVGCGSEDTESTPTPTLSPTVTAEATLPSAAPTESAAPVESVPEEVVVPEPEQVVPSVAPGESVELQFPPLTEQPAPGTDQQTPVDPNDLGAITCETVCTSTGCEQYQYSVLGCP